MDYIELALVVGFGAFPTIAMVLLAAFVRAEINKLRAEMTVRLNRQALSHKAETDTLRTVLRTARTRVRKRLHLLEASLGSAKILMDYLEEEQRRTKNGD